jgi:hypothetical protein
VRSRLALGRRGKSYTRRRYELDGEKESKRARNVTWLKAQVWRLTEMFAWRRTEELRPEGDYSEACVVCVCLLLCGWGLCLWRVARGRRAALFSRAFVWLLSALCGVLTYVCVRVLRKVLELRVGVRALPVSVACGAVCCYGVS